MVSLNSRLESDKAKTGDLPSVGADLVVAPQTAVCLVGLVFRADAAKVHVKRPTLNLKP